MTHDVATIGSTCYGGGNILGCKEGRECTFMVQLWAAVMPDGLLSKTTHWFGGRPSLIDADRNL